MQLKMHMVTIEDLVPKGHFLRKLESALDLSFVYEETAKLYSHRYGRPPYGWMPCACLGREAVPVRRW